MPRPFRFCVNMTTPDVGPAWRERCRRAEELGYDVIQVPDHLGMVAPFPALMAAAEVTERVRLGTFVLNAAFWNPALLAREIATVDALTGGRLEVGIGTGYVAEEHERAGLEFLPPRERVDLLVRTVAELDRLLGDEAHLPRPVQRPRPPLLIGGNGDRVLRLAAEHADITAFAGGRSTGDGGIRMLTADELARRVAAYRGFAAGRAVPAELNLLLQHVRVTKDRAAAGKEVVAMAPYLTEEQALDLPVLAFGTVEEIADQLRARRERFGISSLTVLDPFLEEFGPVIEALRGE
ncbi:MULTISPECIES: TIGR03621 family F420-dependent LLM class oxidoreductase [unclassified Streptomyces]|uniref:TIGR03621 family F420-dependent LLM class oxidoreductase n=1 Tax=unclassified Streptomyces TaxID=2593676 RepID=UPI002E2D03A8|nr:TIGR03621 family F420-dependent LLM class oxidoreductase [Streptomyces sp. NBC_01429]